MAADVYESSVSIANPPIPTHIDTEYMKAGHLDMSKYLELLLGKNNHRRLTDIQMLGMTTPVPMLVSAMTIFPILKSNYLPQ